MKCTAQNPLLLLLAAAVVTGPLAAQTRNPEPPKEPAKREAPKADAPKADAPNADAREVAKKAAHFETVYRDRMARTERLIAIYTAKGDRAKVTELEALREAQRKRHANAMEGFRKQLGPEKWGRLEKEMKGPSERARKVRNEHANENEKEREARKAAEPGKGGAKPAPEKPKERPPSRPGGKN